MTSTWDPDSGISSNVITPVAKLYSHLVVLYPSTETVPICENGGEIVKLQVLPSPINFAVNDSAYTLIVLLIQRIDKQILNVI